MHPQVALLIPGADVAGEVPPLADGFLRGIRALPVAMERFWRAETHNHFSRHPWLDHVVGQHAPCGVGGHNAHILMESRTPGAGGLAIEPGADGEGVHLGAAEVIDEHCGLQALEAELGQRAGHRRTGVADLGQRAEVDLAELGMADEIVVERGNQIEAGELLLRQILQRRRCLIIRQEHQLAVQESGGQ